MAWCQALGTQALVFLIIIEWLGAGQDTFVVTHSQNVSKSRHSKTLLFAARPIKIWLSSQTTM